MYVKRLSAPIALSLVLFATNARAQGEVAAQSTQSSSPAVTASVSAEGAVRIVSLGQVRQI